ncbi:MAG TPA: alpha/beta hydrolase [Chryseolinea sp.]|nr:alpha/beta hydrolase [Chryseolinea sp.]
MRNISLTILTLMLSLFCHGQTPFEKKTYVYKTVEKTAIRADLYRNTATKEARPVIVWIHGGALIGGNRLGLPEDQRKFYMDEGYNVVSIDYRLAPETKIPAILEDVKDAITWVRKNGAMLGIDPSKLYVVGHSAGGYLALATGYILKDPPKGIVSFYGYGDIRGDWYAKPDSFYVATRAHVTEQTAMSRIADTVVTMSVSGDNRGDIYMYCRQNGKWPLLVGGKDPVKDEKWFYQYCPARNVSAKYPPTILLHGDKDSDVPFQQSVEMDRELTAKNVKHKFIPVRNGEHGFDRATGVSTNPGTQEVFAEVASFLATCR